MSLLDENITECLDDVLIPYEDIEQYLKKYTWYDELKLDSLDEVRDGRDHLDGRIKYIQYFRAIDLDNKQYKLNGLTARKFELTDEDGRCHIRFPFHNIGTRILYLITNDQYFEIPKWLKLMSKVDNFAVAIIYGVK